MEEFHPMLPRDGFTARCAWRLDRQSHSCSSNSYALRNRPLKEEAIHEVLPVRLTQTPMAAVGAAARRQLAQEGFHFEGESVTTGLRVEAP